jgi:small subunit ribosomal protein S6
MRYYETTYILSPDLSAEERQAIQTKLKDVIAKHGRLVKEDDWGRRRLAYAIDHKEYGNYIYLVYEADESTVHKLEHEMNLLPEILRYLSVKVKNVKPFLPKVEQQVEEQQGSE